jgi:hypothetical protein
MVRILFKSVLLRNCIQNRIRIRITGCLLSLMLDGVTDTAAQLTLPFTAGYACFLLRRPIVRILF